LSEEEIEELIDPRSVGNSKSLRELLRERDALDSLDPASRSIAMVCVGTGHAPELDRVTGFLTSRFQMPITSVTYNVFKGVAGTQMLVRELADPDQRVTQEQPKGAGITLEDLSFAAERAGIGGLFSELREAGELCGLYPRVWKTSVMFAPPANRTRTLYTVWTSPANGRVRVYLAADAFTEFFRLSKPAVVAALGSDGWRELDAPDVESFSAGLKSLFSSLESTTAG
jgi:hypothetical protein